MQKLISILPPTTKIGLCLHAAVCATLHFSAAVFFAVGAFRHGNFFLGALLGGTFLLISFRAWRLRRWAYQITAAVLLCMTMLSVWWFFPPFVEQATTVFQGVSGLLIFVLFPFLFLGACIFYSRDFIQGF